MSLKKAFFSNHYVPLPIANPEGTPCQSDKSSLRNFLIVQSKNPTTNIHKNAAWFIDGMAAVRSLKSRKTYGEWIDLLLFMEPLEE